MTADDLRCVAEYVSQAVQITMRYSHRNGEKTPPEVPGWYFFDGHRVLYSGRRTRIQGAGELHQNEYGALSFDGDGIEVRGVVDDQIVYRRWSARHGWRYLVEPRHLFAMWHDDGVLRLR